MQNVNVHVKTIIIIKSKLLINEKLPSSPLHKTLTGFQWYFLVYGSGDSNFFFASIQNTV